MTDTMTEQPELLPCPFCGSSRLGSGGDDKIVGVWCENCQASGPNGYLTINGDFDWNTRAPDPALSAAQARIAELEGALENMVGAFDTPISRRRIDGNVASEARTCARAALAGSDG